MPIKTPLPSHRIGPWLAAVLACLVLGGAAWAAKPDGPTTGTAVGGIARAFPMMTTTVEMRVVAGEERLEAADAAISRAQAAMQELIDVINTWDPASQAAQINAQAGQAPVKIDPRLMEVLERSQKISAASGGAFDVTFFPLGLAWNVRSEHFTLPTPAQVEAARALVNWRDLVLAPQEGTAFLKRAGMRIELGAIAKGAAVDVAVAALRASGFPDALVRASGDTFCAGSKGGDPWIVGIQHPRGAHGQLLGKVALKNQAITTSGDYEKMKVVNGKRYHHIVDPRTGRPAELAISATVVGPQAETADALATAVLLLGPREGLEFLKQWPGYEALIVDPSLKITRSAGFPPFVEP